jgi:hypothetical protein
MTFYAGQFPGCPVHKGSMQTTGARCTDFLFSNLFSMKFLDFFIISSLFSYYNLFVSIFIQSHVNNNLHVSVAELNRFIRSPTALKILINELEKNPSKIRFNSDEIYLYRLSNINTVSTKTRSVPFLPKVLTSS